VPGESIAPGIAGKYRYLPFNIGTLPFDLLAILYAYC
jgi:hypothetical protein